MLIPALHIRPSPEPLGPLLDAVRAELAVPEAFPAGVEAEAAAAAEHGPVLPPGAAGAYEDRLDLPLVTIDPEGSRDLDQAYTAERRAGGGFRVHYAIADVAAFVAPDGLLDTEAWARGVTLYQPDRRTPLYPESLGQGAASLLPDVERPALLWTIDLDTSGEIVGDPVVRRAAVRSRAQLTYAGAQAALDDGSADEALVLLREIGTLRDGGERTRGGISLQLPAQEVMLVDGRAELHYEVPLAVEGWNAHISLLTGIAAARIMLAGTIGILRTLPAPRDAALDELRRRARALAQDWPAAMSYPDFVRTLDPRTATGAALLNGAARTLGGAGYTAFDGVLPDEPVHAAVASTYAHVTAPLRRLADRYANEVVLALAAGRTPPEWARARLPDLPAAMAAGSKRQRAVERAVVDLAEALTLAPRVGETFAATVVSADDKGHATIQLRDPAVIAPLDAKGINVGAELPVRLTAADPATRTVTFVPAAG